MSAWRGFHVSCAVFHQAMSRPEGDQERRTRVLEALGSYQKLGALSDDIGDLADMLMDESDRGVVVILGSLIEDALLARLMGTFTSLSNQEQKNLIRGGGLLSSFDHKVTLAHATGTIDQETVDMLKVIKAMRNACAHSRLDIKFSTPQLHDALSLLFAGPAKATINNNGNPLALRFYFIISYLYLSDRIKGISRTRAAKRSRMFMDAFLTSLEETVATYRASLEKRNKRRAQSFPQSSKG